MVQGDVVAFSLVAAVVLVTALFTVMSKRLFHSALFLAAALIGVAVVFLTLNAEFLFAVQILVYVGAIVTLIIFGIMFTYGSAEEER